MKSQLNLQIAPIQPSQDAAISCIIRFVGEEFGATGEGFGPSDAEVSCMSRHYNTQSKSLYLVATLNGKVVGGGGVAKFCGSNEVCELRKVFLRPQSRGMGIGRKLTELSLAFAQSQGYRQCYLDTLSTMVGAIKLYQSLGFTRLNAPLDGVVHTGCDTWMLKEL